jgi:hypothetical protein
VKQLAGFEEGDDLACHFDRGARSRVPAGASLSMLDREGTEAAYLDASTPSNGITSMDLFVMPTLSFPPRYGFLSLLTNRRRIMWLGVTQTRRLNGLRDK